MIDAVCTIATTVTRDVDVATKFARAVPIVPPLTVWECHMINNYWSCLIFMIDTLFTLMMATPFQSY
jgi:hypothetical protein